MEQAEVTELKEKHVLLVEDDENDAFFMMRAFRKAGLLLPLQIATDGQMAIQYLQGTGKFADRERYPLPCLVMTDVKLPQVMGLELVTWIRESSCLGIPVVVFSSSADDNDVREAYQRGANAYLVKPPETASLDAIVRSVTEFWLRRNTSPSAVDELAAI